VQVAVRLGLGRSHRILNDYLVRIGADVLTWRPSAIAEVAYTHHRTAVAAAAGVSGNGPYGTLPRPTGMGPVYQQFIAPTWSRAATPSSTFLGALTVRQGISSSVALLGQAQYSSISPRGTPAAFSPTGSFSEWRVEFGVVGR
jgi:hypothetical protein